jgi:PqqD family protein of HPr-rel-A system
MDEEFLVFNPLSDEIHRLNPMAAAVLAELETAPMDLSTLGSRMACLLEMVQDSDLQQQLSRILADFDEIGLIIPAPTDAPQA